MEKRNFLSTLSVFLPDWLVSPCLCGQSRRMGCDSAAVFRTLPPPPPLLLLQKNLILCTSDPSCSEPETDRRLVIGSSSDTQLRLYNRRVPPKSAMADILPNLVPWVAVAGLLRCAGCSRDDGWYTYGEEAWPASITIMWGKGLLGM